MNAKIAKFAVILVIGCGYLHADGVYKTIPLNFAPSFMVVNPLNNKVYISSTGTRMYVLDGATYDTTSFNTPTSNTNLLSWNPVTNKVYTSGGLGIFDCATNTATSIDMGWTDVVATVVNPVTNKIYVALPTSIKVIDGNTSAVTLIDTCTAINCVGNYYAIAINQLTNNIFVTGYHIKKICIINGYTNAIDSVTLDKDPRQVVVSQTTNSIYVTHRHEKCITVINGSTYALRTIAIDSLADAMAINQVTNKIYITHSLDNGLNGTVTIIDGATDAVTKINVGLNPVDLAVNSVTNKIYVINSGRWSGALRGGISVIDGNANTESPIEDYSGYPSSVAINPVTGKVYIASYYENSITVIDGSEPSTSSISTGTSPAAIAVNPLTNRIYAANRGNNTVSAIDGASGGVTSIAAGTAPSAIAVNPVTNKTYVANSGSGNVTVIDGVSASTATVAAGENPDAVAVNPVSNRIYVANRGSSTLTVINGTNNTTQTVATGSNPCAVAVNPVTNRIYAANGGANTVSVIDGGTHWITPVTVGAAPRAIAVNPVTNKIYVADSGSNTVTVIDGTTNTTATVACGGGPGAIVVNQAFNRIFVANRGGNSVTVIDGATNAVTTVTVGTAPAAIALDPITYTVFVANFSGATISVLDGASLKVTPAAAGTGPCALAVNPMTGRVYAANYGSNTVTVLDESIESDVKIRSAIDTVSGNTTLLSQPTLTGYGVNRWTPKPTTPVVGVMFGTGSLHKPFRWSTLSGGVGTDSVRWAATWGNDSLLFGENHVVCVAMESNGATTNNNGFGTPIMGNPAFNPVYRVAAAPTGAPALVMPSVNQANVSLTTELRWRKTASAWRYGIQLVKDSLNGTVIIQSHESDTMKAPPAALATSTRYYWRVCAINAGGVTAWSVDSFTTVPAIPDAPLPIAPFNGAGAQQADLSLTWSKMARAVSYQVQVSLSSGFEPAGILIDSSGVPAESLAVKGLSYNTTYFWKVRAVNPGGQSAWSAIFNFTTTAAPPGMPILLSPSNGSTGIPTTARLLWQKVSGALSYRVQCSSDSTFPSLSRIDSSGFTAPGDTSLTINTFTNSTRYYWRVDAINTGGNVWSGIWNFTTIIALPLPVEPALPSDTAKQESVTFIWHASTPAISRYRLDYSRDSLLTNVITDSTLTDTMTTVTGLLNTTNYWWRVRAKNAAGWGPFGRTQKFVHQFPTTATLPKVFAFSLSGMASGRGLVSYAIPQATDVSIAVYDIKGRLVAMVKHAFEQAGCYSISLDNSVLGSGQYLLQFRTDQVEKNMLFTAIR